jgi:hypothetical protein
VVGIKTSVTRMKELTYLHGFQSTIFRTFMIENHLDFVSIMIAEHVRFLKRCDRSN